MDAIGYSTLPSEQQAIVFRQLQDLVSECATVANAAQDGNVVRTPTGDGMALAFFDHCSSPLRCALELVDLIQNDRSFSLRMGIHTGAVVRQPDINGNPNVSGDGINIAQRVMDFGDGGHILMSLEYASLLQQSGDPAAADCYDIGVATAKHGKRVHLFNYHRPAAGTVDIPVKVRKDDQWIRPKELHLGTTGRNIVLATLQIIGWLLVAPSKWQKHVTQIDPRLEPNFSVIDLSGAQIRRNRDLRQLLIQGYIICPFLSAAVTLLGFWALHAVSVPAALFSIAMIATMGSLAAVLLGTGVGFVAFVILLFQALVEVPLGSLFGPGSLPDLIALGAVCAWAAVALSAVLPMKRRYPAWREIVVAVAASSLVYIAYAAIVAPAAGRAPIYRAISVGFVMFLMATIVLGLRWKRWSRGFVFGQFVGLATAVALFARASTPSSPLRFLLAGATEGWVDAVLWAAAFAIADKFSGARAAVLSGLVMTCLYNVTGWKLLIPLAFLFVSYALLKRRDAAVSGDGGGVAYS